jgi:ribonuclease P protein component
VQKAEPNYPARALERSSRSGIGDTIAKPSTFRRLSRLTNSAEFDRVFRENQRSVDDFFTVLYRPNGLMRPRLGLAIAKKMVRRAVARNRLKRIIRESFRVTERQLNGIDIVIMARQKAESALNRELFASLDRHWQLLCAPVNKTEHH